MRMARFAAWAPNEPVFLGLAVLGFVLNRPDHPIYMRPARQSFIFEQPEGAEDEARIGRRDYRFRVQVRFSVE